MPKNDPHTAVEEKFEQQSAGVKPDQQSVPRASGKGHS